MNNALPAPVSPQTPIDNPMVGPRPEGEHSLPSAWRGEVVRGPGGEFLALVEGDVIVASDDLPADVSGEAGVEKIRIAHDP